MSDDKREKLREYLRNNRPKNRANLCNNSNDKENFNKNLENDLNLDNSQISHNKTNSHKRDYDKEPLVIKDYNSEVSGVWLLFVVVFLIAVFASGQISLHAFGVAVVTISIYIGKTDKNSPKNGVFKFTSEYIYYSSDIKCKEIKLNEISNTLQALYEVRNETKRRSQTKNRKYRRNFLFNNFGLRVYFCR